MNKISLNTRSLDEGEKGDTQSVQFQGAKSVSVCVNFRNPCVNQKRKKIQYTVSSTRKKTFFLKIAKFWNLKDYLFGSNGEMVRQQMGKSEIGQ